MKRYFSKVIGLKATLEVLVMVWRRPLMVAFPFPLDTCWAHLQIINCTLAQWLQNERICTTSFVCLRGLYFFKKSNTSAITMHIKAHWEINYIIQRTATAKSPGHRHEILEYAQSSALLPSKTPSLGILQFNRRKVDCKGPFLVGQSGPVVIWSLTFWTHPISHSASQGQSPFYWPALTYL